MQTIKIINSPKAVFDTYDLTFENYYNPKLMGANIEFDNYVCLIQSHQILIDFARHEMGEEYKLGITSTFRPWDDPKKYPPAHRIEPPANDIATVDTKLWSAFELRIITEFKYWRKSVLIQSILDTGCNVLIIESGCLHTHWRTDHNNHPDDKKYPNGIYLGWWEMDADGTQHNASYSI